MSPANVNLLFATLSVIAQIASVVLLLSLAFPKLKIFPEQFINHLAKKGMLYAGIVALTGSLGSLLYSNVFGYAPCVFCWIQRICLYPIAFLLLAGYFRKDKNISFYAVVLSAVGSLFALYNHFIQIGFNPLGLSCAVADSNGVSCAKVFVFEFGYMTMPLMSFTAFVLIIVLLLPSIIRKVNN
jgi:disulfide bond formation protein DsbB